MKSIIIVTVLFIAAMVYSDLKCNEKHEHLSNTTHCCPSVCPGQVTCQCLELKQSCDCDYGYSRNSKTKKCERCPCGPNEELSKSCCQLCPNQDHCDCMKVEASCECKPGFMRNSTTNKCVRCPSNPVLVCNGPHEHLSNTTHCCPSVCPGQVTCQCLELKQSCDCDYGYSRNSTTQKCERCPCGPNEELSKSCCQLCPNQDHCDCMKAEASCECKPGFMRNSTTNKCVRCQSTPVSG